MGDPFHVMAAGCGGFLADPVRPPVACPDEPTFTGLRVADPPRGRGGSGSPMASGASLERTVSVWQGFACDRHAAQLVAARPLLPRDRDRLAARRDRSATELGGRRWAGEREGALARGRAARELVAMARRWADRHPTPSPDRTESADTP